jgi:tRNA A-37 threonylcarbamoyl transferase component Bud32
VTALGIALLPAALAAVVAVRRAPRRAAAAAAGPRRLGSYELVEKLGEGGMGEVWRARHATLNRPAAVKLIRPQLLDGEDAARRAEIHARFDREAQSTAGLRSPHTVSLYDFGRGDDGTIYYAMELLGGCDLSELVRQAGPLPAERVVHLLRQICHSLREAHAAGLIHRDIKPQNVRVTTVAGDRDFVKVLDFGLVKQRGESADPGITGEVAVIGTPAFLAPEQAMSRRVDERIDLYARAAVGAGRRGGPRGARGARPGPAGQAARGLAGIGGRGDAAARRGRRGGVIDGWSRAALDLVQGARRRSARRDTAGSTARGVLCRDRMRCVALLLLAAVAACDQERPPEPPCEPVELSAPWSEFRLPALPGGVVCHSDAQATKIVYPEETPLERVRDAFQLALAAHGFRLVVADGDYLDFDVTDGRRGITCLIGFDRDQRSVVVDVYKNRNATGALW